MVGAELTPGYGFKLDADGSWSVAEIPQNVLEMAQPSGMLTIEGYGSQVFEMPDGSMWAQKTTRTASVNFAWITPDLVDEEDELARVAHAEDIDVRDLRKAAESASMRSLGDSDWQRLEGTSSYDVKGMEDATSITERYGRDIGRIVSGMAMGANMPAPIILERADGSIVLVSGNARLMAARAVGAVPEVLWIHAPAAPDPLVVVASRVASKSRLRLY